MFSRTDGAFLSPYPSAAFLPPYPRCSLRFTPLAGRRATRHRGDVQTLLWGESRAGFHCARVKGLQHSAKCLCGTISLRLPLQDTFNLFWGLNRCLLKQKGLQCLTRSEFQTSPARSGGADTGEVTPARLALSLPAGFSALSTSSWAPPFPGTSLLLHQPLEHGAELVLPAAAHSGMNL